MLDAAGELGLGREAARSLSRRAQPGSGPRCQVGEQVPLAWQRTPKWLDFDGCHHVNLHSFAEVDQQDEIECIEHTNKAGRLVVHIIKR